jgi:type III pantothenate kinase
MLSGVLNGAAAEVTGLVADYRQRYPGLGLVLTGGDAPYLQPHLAPALGLIFVVPELVLVGLDRILRHNVDR